MFKVDWKCLLSLRLNDTIAIHWALRTPYPTLPYPLHNLRSSTFETPFAGYHLYFSYASFSYINCRLHQSLSCVPWRETERVGAMEKTHAEYNLVASLENICVCVWQAHFRMRRVGVWSVCVCVCVCVCTCLNLGKHIYMCTPASLCTSWMWVALCVCVFAWRRKEENRINQHVSAVGVQRHEAARFRLFSPLMCFDSVGEIKKYRCGNQEQVALRQVTVRHLTAETPKKRRRGGREWKRDGGLRRRSSVFACGGGRRLMLAGILDVICVQL